MELSVAVSNEIYQCTECTTERGRPVRSLARMIPRSCVVGGELIGREYWCCPLCHRPKFDLKRKPFKMRV